MDFGSCRDHAIGWIAVWKIEGECDPGDFGADRNHAETFGHLGKQVTNTLGVREIVHIANRHPVHRNGG